MHYPSVLRLEEWDDLTSSECEEVAHEVNRALPSPFRFDGIEAHELGDQKHMVSFFRWNDRRFALIPGADATLGFDRSQPFLPTEEEIASWMVTKRRHRTVLADFLESALTPVRQVTIHPLLLEVQSVDLVPPPVRQADGTVRQFRSTP